jgi:RNA polymerase sigma-70 factor (ECF subfamily)
MSTDASAVLPLVSIPAADARGSHTVEQILEHRARSEFERHALEHRADLYRFAFWFTGDPSVAEDAVQEALLRAWQAWNGLRDASAVKSWLLTIVRRECARVYERKRHATTDIDEWTAAEQYLIAAEDDTEIRDVRRAILRLDETYREPLILQVLMGYSTEEIAQMIGIKRGAVLTRLCRARQKLAEQIHDHD